MVLRRTPRPRPAEAGPPQWAAYAFGLVFATFVALFVYKSGGREPARASATVQGYRVLDEREVEITVGVERDPSETVVCLLRALDGRGIEVGSGSVTVPAASGGPEQVRVSAVVVTRSAGVTAEAGECAQAAR